MAPVNEPENNPELIEVVALSRTSLPTAASHSSKICAASRRCAAMPS
jgi:hypothetical protein